MCKTCAKRVKKCVKLVSLTQKMPEIGQITPYPGIKQKEGVHTTPEKKVNNQRGNQKVKIIDLKQKVKIIGLKQKVNNFTLSLILTFH